MYFNIQSIILDGKVTNPAADMGRGEDIFNVSKIGMEKRTPKEANFIVIVDFERKMNDKTQFRIKVETNWLLTGLEDKEIDKCFNLLQILIVRSVSHLYAQLACKYQENGWMMMLPHNDPELGRAFELTRDLLNGFFRGK